MLLCVVPESEWLGPITYSLEVIYALSWTIPQTDEGYNVLSVPALSIFRPVFSWRHLFGVANFFFFSYAGWEDDRIIKLKCSVKPKKPSDYLLLIFSHIRLLKSREIQPRSRHVSFWRYRGDLKVFILWLWRVSDYPPAARSVLLFHFHTGSLENKDTGLKCIAPLNGNSPPNASQINLSHACEKKRIWTD